MPEGATIEITGLDELIRKLDELGKLSKVKAGIKGAALHLAGALKQYPRRRTVTIAQAGGWASEKQRRWFFANLKEGKIKVPYQRTDALKNRWAIKTEDQGFTAVVGNNTPYGPFVMGYKQTNMMRMRDWKTVDVIAKEETKRVQEYVFDAVRRAIQSP